MRKSRKANIHTGRVRIEIASTESGLVELTVARACNNPIVLKIVDEVLDEIRHSHPKVAIKEVEPETSLIGKTRRRGGPIGMPEDQRLKIVKGWFNVQGRVKETLYARSQGISTATLRRWIRELGQQGKL